MKIDWIEILNTAGPMCSAGTAKAAATIHQFLVQLIVALWPWQWFLIITGLTIWVIVEIITRNGTFHYNSENGFSPKFNSFVGTCTYAGLQGLFYWIVTTIFGPWIYCFIFPIMIHYLIFRSTGRFLNLVGFWPRLENPNKRIRKGFKRKLN